MQEPRGSSLADRKKMLNFSLVSVIVITTEGTENQKKNKSLKHGKDESTEKEKIEHELHEKETI